MVDSNPFSVTISDSGFVVADAGGNDLLAVDESGAVSLIAAFPPFEAPSLLSVRAAWFRVSGSGSGRGNRLDVPRWLVRRHDEPRT